MIAGAGANIGVQIGDDGVVLVDTGSAEASDQVLAEIGKLTNKPIRYIINSNGDPDHVGGNEKLSKAGKSLIPQNPNNNGRGGGVAALMNNGGAAGIFTHDNVVQRMLTAEGNRPAYPMAAVAGDTYNAFDREKDTYLNGEGIQILYQPAAHTDGDSLVFFRRSDVVVAGDVFNTDRWPVIDLAHGGSIQGEIDALNRIIGITIPAVPLVWQEGGTLVIPGHGRICDEADVVEYRDMITIIRDVIQDLIKQGKTLAQVQEADPTKEYRPRYGKPSSPVSTDSFVESVYKSLTSGKQGQKGGAL
jgi:glyoxylase-like metal-dependent hydrolase (beta-lactamase superfamily II)